MKVTTLAWVIIGLIVFVTGWLVLADQPPWVEPTVREYR